MRCLPRSRGSCLGLESSAFRATVAWLGLALSDRIGIWFPRIAGGALLFFGLFYLYRQLTGHTHAHLHSLGGEEDVHEHTHEHPIAPPIRRGASDLAAISSLLALLTFSPCEAFIAIYVSGVRYGWSGFAFLTVILSVATVAGMLVFTWLALTGIEQVKLRWFEKHESAVIGALLCTVGVLIILFEK